MSTNGQGVAHPVAVVVLPWFPGQYVAASTPWPGKIGPLLLDLFRDLASRDKPGFPVSDLPLRPPLLSLPNIFCHTLSN